MVERPTDTEIGASTLLVVLAAGLGIIAIAVFFLAHGSRGYRRAKRFEGRSLVTRGRVTDVRMRDVTGRSNFSRLFFPVVEYALPDGRRVEAESRVGSDPTPARTGDLVQVRYDPSDPKHVVLTEGAAQPQHLAGMHILLGVLGIAFGVFLCGFWALFTLVLGVPT